MLKIGYFADGPWSHVAFDKLISDSDIQIDFICVRYDTVDETLKNYCEQYNLPYLKHSNINSIEFLNQVKEYGSDLFVSMSFNQIFRTEIINLPRLKTINCHAGKLPFYRGRNILNWALINDEDEYGITVHFVDEGIDTGDIILQRTYEISDEDNYGTLLKRAHRDCADILYDAIRLFVDGDVESVKQDTIDPLGFYCTQRKIGDENLDWNQTSRELFNFIRAICKPGPQARAWINGAEMKINKIKYFPEASTYKCITGAVLNKDSEGIVVKTSDSYVKIVDYEFEGRVRVGDRFELK